MNEPSRRIFLKVAGAASAASIANGVDAASSKSAPSPKAAPSRAAQPYAFFKPAEARFVESAVARLIPSDAVGPGAIEAGVPHYIDAQLAGAWGAGERLYKQGPWHSGAPTQGYQLPYTPAELFRNGLRAIDDDLRRTRNTRFDALSPSAQDAYLTALQRGEVELGGLPSNVFFESLLELTVEGFFGDPMYGGNRDMVSWRMIGFPGAYASYYHLVDQHGIAFNQAPMSLADKRDGHGMDSHAGDRKSIPPAPSRAHSMHQSGDAATRR
ncbi:MAG TPA: gluconate 2-dehydrogenase subunit 3 family protein [Burkholderiaceae bacterium]|nr:gluconate 2-dehydrogenase subunit 3 family protein [Burkholderiaceae bacterium]